MGAMELLENADTLVRHFYVEVAKVAKEAHDTDQVGELDECWLWLGYAGLTKSGGLNASL